MAERTQVLLVHGAWHGGWAFDPLLTHLEQAGLDALTVELPSSGGDGDLAADAAVVRAAVTSRPGPALLVGHSYGGVVISEAAADLPGVRGLVYICALQIEVGESLLGTVGGTMPPWIDVDEATGTSSVPDPLPYFYGDVPPAVARGLADRLKPQTLSSFTDAQTRAAWQDLPSTYILCEQDGAIPPALQEVMAARAGTVHRLESSHSPFVSQPAALAALIAAAVG